MELPFLFSDIVGENEKIEMTNSTSILRYLSSTHMPQLLGRNSREFASIEYVLSLIETNQKLIEYLESKTEFICGKEPTFVDFCVYEILREQATLSTSVQAYVKRVAELPEIHVEKEQGS